MAEIDASVQAKGSPQNLSGLHRIYPGSPLRYQTPKRLFQCASIEETSVYRARKVNRREALSPGEVFITHSKAINTNADCLLALAKLGVSEPVLVSEALIVLTEEVNEHFQSLLYHMPQYSHDASIILGSVADEKGYGFHAFAYGIHKACKGCEGSEPAYAAVVRSGMTLFWNVLEDAAEENPDNNTLQWMVNCDSNAEFDIVHGWSSLCGYVQKRNKMAHPFSFIAGDVQLAEEALEVMKFLVQQEGCDSKYGTILHLMKAAVPMLTRKVSVARLKEVKQKKEEQSHDQIARQRLPRKG